MTPAVELRGIVKRFGDVQALRGVDFEVQPGEVHALLGENGAGKSTLMKILYGLYRPDAGAIRVNGAAATIRAPTDAIALGIGMVTQHFALARTLTVVENVVLGRVRGLRFDYRSAREQVAKTAEQFGLEVNLDAQVASLSVGQQQRVEILKALYRDCRVLILDEPTAVLTPQEVQALFRGLRQLVTRGLSVVFISHKLDEVLDVSHRITVLRGGVVAGRAAAAEATAAQLARWMVGRELPRARSDGATTARGRPVLEVEDLHAHDGRGVPALRGVSFMVHAGEILGIVGVSGNGQSTLVDVLCGLQSPSRGQVRVAGRHVSGVGPLGLIRAGVARIPEDRLRGVVLDLSVSENLALESLEAFTGRVGSLKRREMVEAAAQLIREFQIRATPFTRAGALSGGNLQRVILGRALRHNPLVVVAAQPTRGLDVAGVAYVHDLLRRQRARGAGVLLVSEDLEEVLSLADRVAVMFGGRIVAEMPAQQAEPTRLGLLMAGAAGAVA